MWRQPWPAQVRHPFHHTTPQPACVADPAASCAARAASSPCRILPSLMPCAAACTAHVYCRLQGHQARDDCHLLLLLPPAGGPEGVSHSIWS